LLRCFVAVEVAAPSLRRVLEGVQGELRRAFGTPDPVKWVPAHQFHFTLKFFGEIPEEDARRAETAMARVVAGVRAFPARVQGLGAFPSAERPSVIWAGMAEGAEPLVALAAAVEREMALEGFPVERRRFQPHLTIGRVREGARMPKTVPELLLRNADRDFGSWRVDRLVLMRSELTPRGPIYSQYAVAALREEIGQV